MTVQLGMALLVNKHGPPMDLTTLSLHSTVLYYILDYEYWNMNYLHSAVLYYILDYEYWNMNYLH